MKRIFLFLLLLPTVVLSQHSIKGTFSPAGTYEVALLYKVEPTVSSYVSNTKIEADGSFEFKLDSTVTKGMYRLVYALPQEEYNFDIIYNAKEDIELVFNSETGVDFKSSHENKLLQSYTNSMLMITNSIGNYFRDESKEKDTLALATIFKTQKDTQKGFEEAAQATIASHFIKANKPYVPNKVENVKTYVKHLQDHYFDHVDFNNEVLQSSSFLTERMLNYVFGSSSESNDELQGYTQNIKVFCEAMSSASKELQKSLLTDLWEQMVDLKLESVANFIAENYLMDLSVALNDQQLLHALILYKNTSIGNEAPNFELGLKDEKLPKSLSGLNVAENYILAFWSSTCSHCLEEIPELHKFVKTYENGKFKVVAIGLEESPYKWNTLTYDLPDFIHVYGEGKWDNKIGDAYGVTSTPAYFVLDKDKKIVSKPVDFEELKKCFEKE